MSAAGGRILARVPTSLHAALVAKAQAEGVSLNQLVVALLAGGIGFKAAPETPLLVGKRPRGDSATVALHD